VSDVRVFRGRDLPLYVFLSAVNLAAVAWLMMSWLGREAWWSPEYIVLSCLVLLPLVSFEARWFALPAMRRPIHMPVAPGRTVGVATTFVPGSEDIGMLERTVRALVAMDYPHETWVLDEGNDARVRALCERLGAHHFSRRDTERYQQPRGCFEAGTKHGNYNAWLDAVGFGRYEIVAAFDPDHVPERRFLTRVLGYFDDPSVGYVQAPQFYYNQRASFVARGAAEETYAYYSSLQMCSYAAGFPILTGCHNTHRVSALREVGGFAAHEADDLLISLLYCATGWTGVYVPERLAAGLVPVDLDGYLKQQRRWARSVLDVKLRALPRLGGSMPLRARLVAFVHGLGYLYGFGTVLGLVLLGVMLATGRAPAVFAVSTAERLLVLYLVLQLCQLFRQRFFLEPERERGLHWRAAILRVAKWPYVLVALADVLAGRNPGYALTRKVASPRRRHSVARSQLLVAAGIAVACIAGATRHVLHNGLLVCWATIVVAASVFVTIAGLQHFPPPYDDILAAREFGDP
jgi:cellulose synthase (UDP-forming)